MDQEIKEILDKQTELLEENTVMLKKMRRRQLTGTVIQSLKWIIILGAAFGFYYRFQPTILRLFEAYDRVLVNIHGVPDFLNSFRQTTEQSGTTTPVTD